MFLSDVPYTTVEVEVDSDNLFTRTLKSFYYIKKQNFIYFSF